MTTLLDFRGVSAGYGRVLAVRDLNLRVKSGEIVALFGPNGAGKTTTLLAASGIVPTMSGSVDVLGCRVDPRHPHRLARRGLAHVPEDRALFFEFTVRENLRLGLRGHREGLAQVLKYFPPLEPLLGRRAGLLSGGEQQMLALGRAIASEPQLLLIDEMSLGLAPKMVQSLLPAIRRIADDRGVGILLVEQHIHLALEVADRVVVLNHGSPVLEDSADALSQNKSLLEVSYLGQSVLSETP